MGLPLFSTCSTPSSSCSQDRLPGEPDTRLPGGLAGNPNPTRFQVIRLYETGKGKKQVTVAELNYPDAKNYEGRKILVYECSMNELNKQKALDPHFCDDKSHLSPFARFEPTERGWAAACSLAGELVKR